jgi:CRISPR/Cas system type I-B associated protein Csh2 (Cas7 group RAMP superfamily)
MSDNKSINIYAVGAVLAFVVFGVLAHGGIFNNTEAEETPVTEEIATVDIKVEEIVVTANEKDLTLDKIHEAAIVNKINSDEEKSENTD